MSRVKKRVANEHEREVDEIVAACRGDLRGAVMALMLINEQLEQKLQRVEAGLIEEAEDQPPTRPLH
jgi:RNase P/RNase MRP subunit POP5